MYGESVAITTGEPNIEIPVESECVLSLCAKEISAEKKKDSIMPNSERDNEECDATDDDSSNAVDLIKQKSAFPDDYQLIKTKIR